MGDEISEVNDVIEIFQEGIRKRGNFVSKPKWDKVLRFFDGLFLYENRFRSK